MRFARDFLGDAPDATPISTAPDSRRLSVVNTACDDPECGECNVEVSLRPVDDPSR